MKTQIFQHRKWYAVVLFMITLSSTNAWGDLTNTYTKVTSVTDLSEGDKVVLATESSSNPSIGVSGQNGTNDAAVSNTEGDWVQYNVALVKSGSTVTGWTLYNPTLEKYIQSPTGNHFKHGDTGGTCSVKTSSDGQYTFTCNSRYLQKNSNYYRMYTSINNNYTPFYVWKVTTGCTGTKLETPVVTATPSSGQVVLSWPAVSNASSYQLKWNGGEWATATSPVTETGLTNGTAYTYQVKAIGNGSTYCDGDASEEASATPNTYYTVTWMNNGSEYTTTSVVSGQRPTFPDAPTSCDDESTTFYGWATSTWSGKIDDISAKTIYTSASAMPTVTSNGTIYHAVFCKGSGGSITLTSSDFADALGQSYSTVTITKTIGETEYEFELNACEPNNNTQVCQMRDNATLSYIAIPSLPGVISRITTSACTNASPPTGYSGTLHFKSAKTRGNANTNDIASVTYDAVTSFDWNLSSNTTYTSGYLLTSAGLRIADLTIHYGSGGSKYLTTCCTPLGAINGSVNLTNYTHLCFSIITLNIMLLQMNKHVKYRFYPLF